MANHRSDHICSIPSCGRKHQARGWCKAHWQRWSRDGNPLAGVPLDSGQEFLAKFAAQFDQAGTCLIWPFRNGPAGYGHIRVDGRHLHAHHYLCAITKGPRPSSKHQAAHNCGNPACVNPHHLRWATAQENAQDRVIHGTVPHGEKHCHAKLSDADVVQIRDLSRSQRIAQIARRFGVTPSTISGIISGRHRRSPASPPSNDKLAAYSSARVAR